MSHHDLNEMRRYGRVLAATRRPANNGTLVGAAIALTVMIRRILHRIACAWMQCDEARG